MRVGYTKHEEHEGGIKNLTSVRDERTFKKTFKKFKKAERIERGKRQKDTECWEFRNRGSSENIPLQL